jgi:hypothetical protein
LTIDNSILRLKSRLAPKLPTSYTVGLSIIDNNTINGMGSVAYLNQVSVMVKGNPNILTSYFVQASYPDPDGYYDTESGEEYYNYIYQQS